MVNKSIGVVGELALSLEQVRLMYNLEFYKTSLDIEMESNIEKKIIKEHWLKNWSKGIEDIYVEKLEEENIRNIFVGSNEINQLILKEFNLNKKNKTWYYLIVLEAELFTPYFPLSEEKCDIKISKKLKFTDNEYISNSIKILKIIESNFVERVRKTYKKSLSRIKGTRGKIIIGVLSTVAITALTFGMAAIFAPTLAVILVGGMFPTLKGMALINACLAFIGGGALAIGGLGVAGGAMIIAGGGALLGLGIGGGVAGGVTMMILKNPNFALTQIAKLEVTMKEIILNAQHDVRFAQEVIKEYKKQIRDCEDLIEELKNNVEINKSEIKEINKTIKYMKKAYEEMIKFKSCFDLDDDK